MTDTAKSILALLLGIVGLVLVGWAAGWQVALGLFLWQTAVNIEGQLKRGE